MPVVTLSENRQGVGILDEGLPGTRSAPGLLYVDKARHVQGDRGSIWLLEKRPPAPIVAVAQSIEVGLALPPPWTADPDHPEKIRAVIPRMAVGQGQDCPSHGLSKRRDRRI